MSLKLYSVYDSKVSAYLQPQVLRSKGEAIRSFGAACNTKDHNFYLYAEDYTLFEIGDWDEETCSVTLHLTPISLGKAIEISKAHSEYYYSSKLDSKLPGEVSGS